MEELNEEEMKGTEGGACKSRISSTLEVQRCSRTLCAIAVNENINKIELKEIRATNFIATGSKLNIPKAGGQLKMKDDWNRTIYSFQWRGLDNTLYFRRAKSSGPDKIILHYKYKGSWYDFKFVWP